jgi:hypothetical protein
MAEVATVYNASFSLQFCLGPVQLGQSLIIIQIVYPDYIHHLPYAAVTDHHSSNFSFGSFRLLGNGSTLCLACSLFGTMSLSA